MLIKIKKLRIRIWLTSDSGMQCEQCGNEIMSGDSFFGGDRGYMCCSAHCMRQALEEEDLE